MIPGLSPALLAAGWEDSVLGIALAYIVAAVLVVLWLQWEKREIAADHRRRIEQLRQLGRVE